MLLVMKTLKILVMLFVFYATSVNGMAQKSSEENSTPDKTRVLLILDCSNSMWDKWQSDSKIKVTQTVLLRFLDSISNKSEIDVALRVFGHLNKKSYGTRLEVPFEKDNIYKLRSKIKTLVPQGGCEAATALSSSLSDFPPTGNSRNIIVIITDGMDDCEGSICDVARQVKNSGVVVKTFVLGIGEKENFQSNLNCAGKFIHIPQEEQYTQSLYDVFRLSEEKAEVKIEVKDLSGMSYETSLPIIFYDAQTGIAKYQTIYSSEKNETLILDPLISYNIEVYSKPSVAKTNIAFDHDKTNNLTFKIEQGFLTITHEAKRTKYQIPEYPIVVRKHGEKEIVNIQTIGEKVAYQAGRYDIEILSTPYTVLNGIDIQHTSNTDLVIPTPGLINITKPNIITRGSVFAVDDGEWKYVCDLDPGKASERLLLMPGDYVAVLSPVDTKTEPTSVTQKFRVDAGTTTNIMMR